VPRGKAAPDKKRSIAIDDLFAFKLIGSPDLSPDGAQAIVTVQRCDLDKNTYYSDLFLVSVPGGDTRQVTFGDYSDSSPVWSPDGKTIAFVSSRSEAAQVHLMPMCGGDSRKLTDLPEGGISGLEWSPDGKKLLVVYQPRPECDSKKAAEERKEKHLSSPVRELESAIYRLDGVGFLSETPPRIYVVEADTGKATAITRGKLYVHSPAWSPDGKAIAFCGNTDAEHKAWAWEVYIVPTEGGTPRRLPTPPGPKGGLTWTRDGKRLLYLGHVSEDDPWGVYNDHVWRVPADGSAEAVDIMADLDQTCEPYTLGDTPAAGSRQPLALSADGGSVDVTVGREGAAHLIRVPLDGAPRTTLVGGHVHLYAHTPEIGGRIVALWQTPTSPGEAFVVEPGKKSKPKQLTKLNTELLGSLTLTEPDERWIECEATGRKVQGWVLKPPGFSPARKYPLLLEIHGGPHTQYGAGFFHEMHWLASKGFVVLYTNPAGSQGRGEAFMQALRGQWGDADFPELMAFVDAVVAEGYIDERRLGVTGGSYGGYMTNWVVTHTRRFAAAATQRCVSNLVSMLGNSDHPPHPDGYFPGNPWSKPEDLWHMSPIRLVEKIRTPLLILHSEGDMRCNIEQAEQVFSALRTLGRKVKFVRFPREASHGLSRGGPPDLRTRRLEALGEWFESYLLPKRK